MIPAIGDRYPIPRTSKHATHTARIVAIDLHGQPSWDPRIAPTLTVECSCGDMWPVDLYEAVACG